MREPIERLWSATKMKFFNEKTNKKTREMVNFDKNMLFALFVKLAKKDFEDKVMRRTRYDLILPKIEKVFKD